MSLLIIWSVIATTLVALASTEYHGVIWGSGAADASTLLWAGAFIGLPAWLSIAALTIKRWNETSKLKSMLQNAPALSGVMIYSFNHYKW